MSVVRGQMFLPARGPFDLRATVLSYGYHELAPCRWVEGGVPRLTRVERLKDGGVHVVHLRPAPGGVLMRAVGPDADQVECLAPLALRMRRVMRLDEDPTPFWRFCRADPALRPIARLRLGRMLRGATLFEDVVKAIAWTNTTWTSAVQTIARLGALGSPAAGHPRRRAFPTPAQLVRVGEDGLRRRARLGYRAEYVVRLAREVTEGLRDLDTLDADAGSLPIDDLAAAFADIRGVGPASVGWLMLLVGRYERAAIDRATLRFATEAGGRRPTVAALEERIAAWGEWQGLALWFQQWLASGHPAIATLVAARRARRATTPR